MCLERAVNAAKTKQTNPNTNHTMKLTSIKPLQARACAVVAISIALVTMPGSKATADDVKVFKKTVSGVPAANHVVISPSVYSPEFSPGLIAEGLDLLENPSGVITRFGLFFTHQHGENNPYEVFARD